jgi:hypothetical protein
LPAPAEPLVPQPASSAAPSAADDAAAGGLDADAEGPAVVAGHRVGPRVYDGGLGPAHLAHAPGGEPVALTLVRAAAAAREGFAASFHRDAQAAGQVRGAALVRVLGSGREGERYWLAAAYEPVRTLAGAGPLPTRTVLRLVSGIAEALRVLHHAGVVHGDLRPAHVLLAAEGPRLKEYGLAGVPGFAPEAGEGPAFLTPEQAAGQPPVPASDVFALGQIAAYAAIGVPPFGEDAGAARTRVRQEEPDLNELPGELREIVTRCLIKDPALRPSLAQVTAMCAQAAPPGAPATPWLPPHLLHPPTPRFPPGAPGVSGPTVAPASAAPPAPGGVSGPAAPASPAPAFPPAPGAQPPASVTPAPAATPAAASAPTAQPPAQATGSAPPPVAGSPQTVSEAAARPPGQPQDSAAAALPPPAAWSGLQVFRGPKFAAPLGVPAPEAPGGGPGPGVAPQAPAPAQAAGDGGVPGTLPGPPGQPGPPGPPGPPGQPSQHGHPGQPGWHWRPPVHLPVHLPARRRRGAGAALAAVVVVGAAGVALAVGSSDGGGGKEFGAAPQSSPTATATASSPPAATSPPTSPSASPSGGGTTSPLPVGDRYEGIRLAAGTSLVLQESPPAVRPGPYGGSFGFTERGDAFATDARHGTLAVLDPSTPPTLASCVASAAGAPAAGSPAAGTALVPRGTVTAGSRICVHSVDGTVALVTLRRLPMPGDPAPYATLDVTVWPVADRSAEGDQ